MFYTIYAHALILLICTIVTIEKIKKKDQKSY
jgi:hypothetical protein